MSAERAGRFPVSQGGSEVTPPPLSLETQRLVEHLRRGEYAVYYITGQTPLSLKADGMRYLCLDPALENVSAAPALVAFKPHPFEFFLRGSQNLPHERQLEQLAEERARVEKQYIDAGLVVREGKLPEWTELAFKHWKTTGVRITGRNYSFKSTWTATYESDKPGAYRAIFGYWHGTDGADVDLWSPDRVDPDLGLAPLVEIPRK